MRLTPNLVISARNFFRGDAFVDSFQHRWRAVHIGTGDHSDFVADDSVESGEDVGWDVHARDVAEVWFAVYIRPCDSYENFARQLSVPRVSDGRETISAQADCVRVVFVLGFIIARVWL